MTHFAKTCRWLLMCALLGLCASVGIGTGVCASITSAGPNDAAEYLLGPGDTLKVAVFDYAEMTAEVRVTAQGHVRLPQVGDLLVAGHPVPWLEDAIADLLQKKSLVVKPQVTVTVVQYRSQAVTVLGEVNRPMVFVLERPTRLSEVLAAAGGIGALGGDEVLLTRQRGSTESRLSIDLARLFEPGAGSSNLTVQGGDVVFVPRAPRFYVYGEVVRPGALRTEPGLTVDRAIALAGGISPKGSDLALRLKRRQADGSFTSEATTLEHPVQAEDTVYVDPAPRFYAYGEVQRPGEYRLARTMTVMKALVVCGGVTARGSERSVRITRQAADGRTQTIDVQLSDVVLPDDVIFVKERLF